MVFCGKHSKGCHRCRKKKTRCDARPSGCSQCARAHVTCPGYRAQRDLIFRDNTKNVIRKVKAKEAKVKKANERSSPDSRNEIVQQSPISRFSVSSSNLAPTYEERATGFFVSNYVVGVHGPTRGHFDCIVELYASSSLGETLKETPELFKDAYQSYTKALRLTNAALASSEDAKKDTTLISVLVLSIFETVTGFNRRSLSAWSQHVNGAAALVKLRGRDQLKTVVGRRLFVQVSALLILNSFQRDVTMPDHILDLEREAQNWIPPEAASDPGWRIHESMVLFTTFNSNVKKGVYSDPQTLISTALDIDQKLQAPLANAPAAWKYQTVFTDIESELVFNGRYDIYYEHWIAQIWNSLRSGRIILHNTIREVLSAGFSSKAPFFTGPEYTLQYQTSTDIICQLQADVFASVPRHIGFFVSDGMSPDKLIHLTETQGTSRSSGGYFLLWPL